MRWGTWSGNVLLSAQTHSGCHLTRETIRATVFAAECGDTLSGWRVVRGTAQAEVRGRDGIRWAWGRAGREGRQRGSPDLCARRYQRPMHLAVSKPFQMNNKLWTLFDRHHS